MKRREFLKVTAIVSCGSIVFPNLAFAQTPERSRERWNQLSPEQKEKLREDLKKFKALTAHQQQELKKAFGNLRSMTAKQRDELKANFKRWQALSPTQREQLKNSKATR